MIKILLIFFFNFCYKFIQIFDGINCLICILILSIYLLIDKIKIFINKSNFKNFYFVIFFFFYFFLFLSFIEETIKLHSYLQFQISDSYRNFTVNENYNSGLNLFYGIESYKDFLFKIPILYFYSVFNPFLENIFHFKYFLLVFENLIFCIFIILTFFTKKFPKKIKLLLVVYLTYIFIFVNIYMFVSYASIGTGFRYSAQLKILLLVLMFILNKEKLDSYFLFYQKIKENCI